MSVGQPQANQQKKEKGMKEESKNGVQVKHLKELADMKDKLKKLQEVFHNKYRMDVK